MADEDQPFRLRRAWPFYVLAGIAVLYFAIVVYIASLQSDLDGIPVSTLALAGLVYFVVLMLVAIPYFRRRKMPRAAPVEELPTFREDMQDEPMESEAPRIVAQTWDDELLRTTEQQQGMTVLEYSTPAKSRHKGAVYAKAYVPVAKDFVLRVETLVAEGADL